MGLQDTENGKRTFRDQTDDEKMVVEKLNDLERGLTHAIMREAGYEVAKEEEPGFDYQKNVPWNGPVGHKQPPQVHDNPSGGSQDQKRLQMDDNPSKELVADRPSQIRRLAEDDVQTHEILAAGALWIVSFWVFNRLYRYWTKSGPER